MIKYEIGRLRGHRGAVKCMQVDNLCLTGAEDGTVRIFVLSTMTGTKVASVTWLKKKKFGMGRLPIGKSKSSKASVCTKMSVVPQSTLFGPLPHHAHRTITVSRFRATVRCI